MNNSEKKTYPKQKAGLFFGSFNPIHIGHLCIANYIVEHTEIDQLWFVVSPQNPLKQKKNLLDDYQRLELVHRAVGKDERFYVCDIEYNLPKPSYTITTLVYLSEKYPRIQFYLIIGSDSLKSFHKWKNYETIQNNYPIIVYPRPGYTNDIKSFKKSIIANAPLMEISSSFIRQSLKKGKDIRHFLPPSVYDYINEMNFYK